MLDTRHPIRSQTLENAVELSFQPGMKHAKLSCYFSLPSDIVNTDVARLLVDIG